MPGPKTTPHFPIGSRDGVLALVPLSYGIETGSWKFGTAESGELQGTRDRRDGRAGERTHPEAKVDGDASTSGMGASSETFQVLSGENVRRERPAPRESETLPFLSSYTLSMHRTAFGGKERGQH